MTKILSISFLFFFVNTSFGQEFITLPNGHSHNDYTRDSPLYDALKYGFTSIEVDVYWHKGRMVVTHDDKLLDEKPTLQELYLNPLSSIIQNNGGTVFKDDETQLVLTPGQKVVAYSRLGLWAGIFAFACVCAYYIARELFPS